MRSPAARGGSVSVVVVLLVWAGCVGAGGLTHDGGGGDCEVFSWFAKTFKKCAQS